MPETSTKDESKLRIDSGAEFWYKTPKTSGTWTDFGIVDYGYEFDDAPETVDIPVAGGNQVTVQKQSTKKVMLSLSQTGKSELALRDTLNGKSGEIYIYDGIVGNKHLEIYIEEAIIWVSVKKKEGDQPQKIEIILSMKRQAALASVQDTELPTVKKATAGTVVGTNNYYVLIDTVIA